MKQLLAILTLVMVAAIASPVLAAPKGTSTIQGVVTESAHGQPVTSVSVIALAANGNAWAGSTQTGKDGVFRLNGLRAGGYRLFVSKPGYRTVEVSGLEVGTSDHLVVGFPIALERAALNESDLIQLVARCNNLVNPGEVADVYVVCGGK